MYAITGLMICFNIYNGSVESYDWQTFGTTDNAFLKLNDIKPSDENCNLVFLGLEPNSYFKDTDEPKTDY